MRTLDPILKDAMDNQYGEPIFRVQIHNGLSSAINDSTTKTLTPYKYKLHNLELEVKIDVKQYEVINFSPVAIRIGRGKKISGIDYYIDSAWYSLLETERNRTFITLKCHIFPKNISINVAGDDDAEVVIQTAIDQTNFYSGTPHTNSFELPSNSEWWHGVQFYPAGKSLLSNKTSNLSSILKQKYLSYLFVKDDNTLSAISKNYMFENEDINTITTNNAMEIKQVNSTQSRIYIWRDENATIHEIDSSGVDFDFPIHNFGFIPSTITPQIDGYQNGVEITLPANLEITPEDFLSIDEDRDIDNGILGTLLPGYCEVEEIFDPEHKYTWFTVIKSIDWLNNTEGGAMPSTIERVAAYTPLVTSGFDNNLDESVNNLQALAEAVDDMPTGEVSQAELDAVEDKIDNHIADTDDAHDASAISYAGGTGMSATDVEAAIDELATEKANTADLIGLYVPYNSANDIFRCDSPGGNSLWTGTINGTPSGNSVTVSAPVTGIEAALVPTSTSQLAKMRLYNLTRGDYALISNYNTGTNVVTLYSTVPASWANGDSLTIVSQTVSGGGANWVDIELITDSNLLNRSALHAYISIQSATPTDTFWTHPTETFGAGKIAAITQQVANITTSYVFNANFSNNNLFTLQWAGTPTLVRLRIMGYYT